MKITIDIEADALYIKFRKGEFGRNKKIDEDTIIDLDKGGKLLGIEMLNITKKIPLRQLSNVSVKMPIRVISEKLKSAS